MQYLILVVGGVAVIAVALVMVGGGVAKTVAQPHQIVFDVQESIEFVAEALPDRVTAELSYDDVRRVLRLHLEWIQAYHFTPEGDPEGPVVFSNDEALPYVMERASVTGLAVSAEQVREVMAAHIAYLQFVGAVHVEQIELIERDLASLDDRSALEPGGTDQPGTPDETPGLS